MMRFVALCATLVLALPIAARTDEAVGQTPARSVAVDQETATISGRATDVSGKPLAGVIVRVDGVVHTTATTDANGVYTLTVPAGVYLLSASHAGYESAQIADLALVPGQKISDLNVTLSGATLQSLRTIGVAKTSAARSNFNTSGISVAILNSDAIVARVQPNLSKLVAELPGVVAGQNSGGRDPNSSWSIRGARTETRVALDGHVVSTGTFGAYNSIFANSQIFQQVEVVKGAGINGPNAGTSAFGTVNLRTRNFTGQNVAYASLTGDIFNGDQYFIGLEHQFGKFGVLAAQSFQRYAGPDQGVPGPVVNGSFKNTNPTVFGYGGPALIQWQQNLSHPFGALADLVKFRYGFSSATTLTAEYLNLVGRYYQQGASYAYDYGPYTVAQCFNGTTAVLAGQPGCGVTSVYNAPQQLAQVGNTLPIYSYFPNSYINDQEPQYSLELKTQYKNDTVFVRPYWAEIRRYIDGTTENQQPGNGGSWYQVTNNANCSVQFTAPTLANGGAKGPCFSSGDNYTTPFVNNVSSTVVPWFPYVSTNAPNCSPSTPCYTTPTQQQRNGLYGYGGPFSQPEFDKLAGVTFSWLHPVGDNLYTLNADYSSDYTTKATADISQLPAGCYSVVGSGVANAQFLADGKTPNPYYQPNCQLGGQPLATLPSNGVSIPPTWSRTLALSLTGLWQVNEKLQLGLGNYLTFTNIYGQFTNPTAIAAAAALGQNGAEQSDATLIGHTTLYPHYDPHFQAEYRVNSNVSLRATAGSSITMPYASLVSGFGSFRPNTSATTDSLTLPNPNLRPEVTVGYDVGGDQRMKDGSVLSIDLYDNNIHNVFVTQQTAVAPLPGRPSTITSMIQQFTVNGPHMLDYGAEITMQKAPRRGLGYYGTVSFERAFYYGFSNDFYIALTNAGNNNFQPLVNGKQLDGTGGFEDQIPFTKGKFEFNYAFPNAYAALGFVYQGANNPYGSPAFATSYANVRFNLKNGLNFALGAENLLNYSQGSFNGQVIANTGFWVQGVKWNPGCNCIVNGSPFSTPNSRVVVQPRNVYFTLSKRFP